jgi:Leucine-rich repeat (LRR) protein
MEPGAQARRGGGKRKTNSRALMNQIPEIIGSLPNLEELDLSNNRLTELPSALSKLGSLVSLVVQGNKLSSLPTAFGNLTCLKILNLQTNHIWEIEADTFSGLSALEECLLGNNQLLTVPSSLGGLSRYFFFSPAEKEEFLFFIFGDFWIDTFLG